MTVAATVNDGGNELTWDAFYKDTLNQHIVVLYSVNE